MYEINDNYDDFPVNLDIVNQRTNKNE